MSAIKKQGELELHRALSGTETRKRGEATVVVLVRRAGKYALGTAAGAGSVSVASIVEVFWRSAVSVVGLMASGGGESVMHSGTLSNWMATSMD